MLEFGAGPFFLVAFVVVLALRVVAPGLAMGARLKPWLLVAATASLFYPPKAWPTALVLLALVATVAISLRLGTGRRAVLLHTAILSLLFVAGQYAARALPEGSFLARAFPLVGLPYVYLRALHLVVQVHLRGLPPPRLIMLAAYLLPFHQLVAGPIERYPRSEAALLSPPTPLDVPTILKSLGRITDGLIKKVVLAELLRRGVGFEFNGTGLPLFVELNLYAIYVYLDFSGYMDMAIGVGMLVGWTPPENFDWPYFSRNLIVFWTRWHMSLGDWIKEHLFLPLNLSLQRGRLGRQVLLTGILSYFAAMVFCGLWHHPSLSFALWGVLHGLAIAAVKVYEAALKRWLSKPRQKAYRQSRLAHVLGAMLTFEFVVLSFVFAFHDFGEALAILGRLW